MTIHDGSTDSSTNTSSTPATGTAPDTSQVKGKPPRPSAGFGAKVNRIEKIFQSAGTHIDAIMKYEADNQIDPRITPGIVEQGLAFVQQMRDGNGGKKILANQFLADTTQEIIDRDGVLSQLTVARNRAKTILEHDTEFQKLMGRGEKWSVHVTGPLLDSANTIVQACQPPDPPVEEADPKNPVTNYGKCLMCGIVKFAPELDAARKRLIESNSTQQRTRSKRVAATANLAELAKTASKGATRVMRIVREIFKDQPAVLEDFSDPNPRVGGSSAKGKGKAKKKGVSRNTRRIRDALKRKKAAVAKPVATKTRPAAKKTRPAAKRTKKGAKSRTRTKKG